jgi:hypothetical protein
MIGSAPEKGNSVGTRASALDIDPSELIQACRSNISTPGTLCVFDP